MILIKLGEEYKLYSHDSCIATTHESPYKKLSKQNCDEIFGVVNLMKLAEEHSHKYYDVKTTDWHSNYNGFFSGFLKATELNKDKLFTVEDMKAIFAFGHVVGMNNILAIQSQHSPQPLPKPDSDKLRDEVIQSLQQPTEIEVRITMACGLPNGCTEPEIECTCEPIPALDENCCLILYHPHQTKH
jgi:hypothetical protein